MLTIEKSQTGPKPPPPAKTKQISVKDPRMPPSTKAKPAAKRKTPIEKVIVMTAEEIKIDDEEYAREQAKIAELLAESAAIEQSRAASSHMAPTQGGATNNDLASMPLADIIDDSETPGIIYNPSQDPHFRDCPCGRWRPHTQLRCQCGNMCYFRRKMDQPPDEQFVQSLPV